MYSQLNINGYHSRFILGNNPEEKIEKTEVIINISFRFICENRSCETDNLEDTICYAELLKFIDRKLLNARFNLIEKAASFVFESLEEYLEQHHSKLEANRPQKTLKKVEIIKLKPDICCCPPEQRAKVPNEFQAYLESASFVISDWD